MIADIVILAIMALCVFLGYKRGLIHVAVRILGFIIAVVAALILYIPVSNFIINNTNAVDSLQVVIQDKFYSEEASNSNLENTNEDLSIEKYIKDSTDNLKDNSAEYLSKEAAVIIVRGLTWIGLFIVVRIVVIFIKIIAKLIEDLPIIKQFNKARRNNIWCIRRLHINLCNACSY